ncbi:MAG: AAA family ATPase [Pseudomonadota bacterium]
MYESFYGFKERPFNTLPDPDFLYMSPKHEMALTYLEYGLSSQAGFTVLTGEIGSGKTTLINYLLGRLDNGTTNVALIFNTNISPLDFLETLLKEWAVSCTRMEKAGLYDSLNDFLLNAYKKKTRVVLIVDEAQNLPFETLEELRMISNLNDEKVPLLHIILAGQPNLIHRLNNPKLEQLRQRVVVHYHLEPLSEQETFVYIEHRLKKAQAKDFNIFSSDAVGSIYTHSQGIPRIINLICDLALVYGYAEQIKPINKNTVNMVVEDRRKMGLGLAGKSRASNAMEEDLYASNAEKTVLLSRKHKELSDNVYELALIVKKMICIKQHVARHDQEIKHLYKKIKGLEEKYSVV